MGSGLAHFFLRSIKLELVSESAVPSTEYRVITILNSENVGGRWGGP